MSPPQLFQLLDYCVFPGTAAAMDERAAQEEFEPLSVHPSLFKMAVIVAGRPTSPKASIARVEASILQVQVHMCEAPTAPLQTAAPACPATAPNCEREASRDKDARCLSMATSRRGDEHAHDQRGGQEMTSKEVARLDSAKTAWQPGWRSESRHCGAPAVRAGSGGTGDSASSTSASAVQQEPVSADACTVLRTRRADARVPAHMDTGDVNDEKRAGCAGVEAELEAGTGDGDGDTSQECALRGQPSATNPPRTACGHSQLYVSPDNGGWGAAARIASASEQPGKTSLAYSILRNNLHTPSRPQLPLWQLCLPPRGQNTPGQAHSGGRWQSGDPRRQGQAHAHAHTHTRTSTCDNSLSDWARGDGWERMVSGGGSGLRHMSNSCILHSRDLGNDLLQRSLASPCLSLYDAGGVREGGGGGKGGVREGSGGGKASPKLGMRPATAGAVLLRAVPRSRCGRCPSLSVFLSLSLFRLPTRPPTLPPAPSLSLPPSLPRLLSPSLPLTSLSVSLLLSRCCPLVRFVQCVLNCCWFAVRVSRTLFHTLCHTLSLPMMM